MTAVRSDAGTGQGAYETETGRDTDRCPNCGHQLADAAPAGARGSARARKHASTPPLPSTAALAQQAREAQRLAAVGSNKRKGAGVLAVVLNGARTVDGARRMLRAHRLPVEIGQAAAELLAELTTDPEQGVTQ